VFVEVGSIRAHEWHMLPWWTRLVRWLRAKLLRRPPHTLYIDRSEGVLTFDGSLRTKLRPSPLATDATRPGRLAWLEKYVDALDDDVTRVSETINGERAAAIAKAAKGDQRLRQETAVREERRRSALKWSLRRQALGAGFIAVGLVVGTVGAVG
jgi:hypothetical protein